ncbi:hypothetical protein [Streptomyces sp. SAS_275]|uniref:hypothetical protein n=1 Tax=Streptomyces sp. SAS_275 TaxID=3412746 RepID=UPI00403C46C1
MTNPADELRTAATTLRDLATRTATTLERHELQWADLTVTSGPDRVSPMVWSQYAAALHPAVGAALAQALDETADSVGQEGGLVEDSTTEALLDTARAINGSEQP